MVEEIMFHALPSSWRLIIYPDGYKSGICGSIPLQKDIYSHYFILRIMEHVFPKRAMPTKKRAIGRTCINHTNHNTPKYRVKCSISSNEPGIGAVLSFNKSGNLLEDEKLHDLCCFYYNTHCARFHVISPDMEVRLSAFYGAYHCNSQ